MEYKIVWTSFAKKQLHDVFRYYADKANQEIAARLTKGIFDKTIILSTSPRVGQKEQLLSDRSKEFRYLVYKNYKIIYWVTDEKTEVVIADIFDTRQQPNKIRRSR